MRLDAFEKGVRLAGAGAALVVTVSVCVGLVRAARHPLGRTSGPAPLFVQRSPLFYVPASAAGLGLLYALWRPIGPALSVPARLAALIVGSLLYFSGMALMLWARLTMGDMYNVSTSLGAQLYADQRLITTGPFAVVRHPMYLGGQLAELGALLLYRTWATALLATNILTLPVRARREEEALAAEFGEQWTEYRRRVPSWIPRFPW